MRHLLTHTSGIDGDIFTDTGRGDDCLERYVALLAEAAQNHPLEATWSYCNSGFSLAGRVIEKITEGTWDAAIKERLVGPLGMTHTGTLPEDALLHRAAIGHVSEAGSEPERAPAWGLFRALGPAGLVNSTPADVLAFARMHLTGGLAPDGTRILSESAVSAMAEHEADLPGQVHPRRLLGARLDPLRLGWTAPDRTRRQHDRPGGVPARPARRGARGHAPHERRQSARSLRGSLPRDLPRARRDRDAAPARAAERAGRGRRRPAPRDLRARRGSTRGARRRRTGRCCARR